MGAKVGVKKHGDKATEAIVSECKQLDDKKAFKPRHQNELTKLQLKQVLLAITLVKEKRNGKLKGRTVADGRGQREHISRDDATSPTASIEALMISIAVDTKERRHVATADVKGAHLHADMDETVIMLFKGDVVDCMAQANPEKHGPYVHTTKKGKKLLCVELLKALHGCIKSASLWHKLFTSTLQKMGFALNPCDQCVTNKMIDGKQCTMCWFFDDLKISHMKLQVIKDIISVIKERCGKMAVTHGNKHTCVGMDIKHVPEKGEAEILMIEHLNVAIEAFPEDCSKPVKTPAALHAFEANKNCPKLKERDRKNLLHSVVAKQKVQIAFLTSRVTKADEDDWKKLKRLLQHVHCTINMPLTLSIDDMSSFKTWADVARALHNDMRSHTGGAIMAGKGLLHGKSSKQRTNVKSSTAAETVGASNFLLQTIWARNFVEAQCYKITNNDFFQDNMSAMKMEKNGIEQWSRHINIRCFFVKDRIASGEIKLIHCPTGIMNADFFTKPLQGLLFEKFRDIIMGFTHCSSLVAPASIDARSVLDGDISEDSPRPIQARLAHDSKDKVSRSPLTRD
jgi:hypothetical protein